MATIKTRISVTDTLLAIKPGQSEEFKGKDIPFLKIKRGVDYLNGKGNAYFKISVAGRIDSTGVTRLK